MSERIIRLTEEELEDVKHEERFRTKVLIQLKALSGMPIRVAKLEVHRNIQWALFLVVIGGLVSMFFNM